MMVLLRLFAFEPWHPRRVLEPTLAAELLALDASRKVRVALDLLLAAGQAGHGEALPRLAGLGHAPVWIHRFAVDHGLAVGAVVVEVARALAGHEALADEARQEVRAGPDARPDGRLSGRPLARRRRRRRPRRRHLADRGAPASEAAVSSDLGRRKVRTRKRTVSEGRDRSEPGREGLVVEDRSVRRRGLGRTTDGPAAQVRDRDGTDLEVARTGKVERRRRRLMDRRRRVESRKKRRRLRGW